MIRKVQNRELLSEEMMQFIIFPLTYKGKVKKNKAIKELFELSKNMEEESEQLFLLSGILVFTDKVIDKETAKRIKEWISMTKVAKLFEEEKLAAVAEAVKKEREQAKQAVKKEREQAKEQALDTATELIKEGFKPEKILKCVKNLTLDDIISLQEKMSKK